MNNQVPWNFSVASGDSEKGQSSRNENSFDFLESSASQLPTSWHQTSHSLDTDVDDFSDVFGNLMDVELSAASSAHFPSSLVSKLETSSCEHDKGQSSGMVKKPDKIVLRKCLCDATEISEGMERKPDNRPKRTHSAEVHNQSERRRRDRINKRLKSLKELVPNCNKSDRASVLDDAVNYVKALRHQLEEWAVALGPEWLTCCSAGHPVISSAPSASLHPSLAAGVGLPLMPASRNLAVSQMQMPCVRSQHLRPSVDTSAMPPKFVLGRYSPAFNFSNEVESSSKTMPGTSNDHHQQDYRPSGHGCLCSVSILT
ncbi:hypothetical protein KPL70_004491 [Citrus sinensis]|nr:hypothetical protein KPL70_004491 [Citrus sinensis]